MKLKLQRRFFADTYTIGTLSINGKRFCDTLEDRNRDINKNGRFDGSEKKIMHQTAIPFGIYAVTVGVSPRFKRELPRILNVPEFDGVLIHRGNTHEHTSGCILVGENKEKGKVLNSAKYELELVKLCKSAIDGKEQITLEIV